MLTQPRFDLYKPRFSIRTYIELFVVLNFRAQRFKCSQHVNFVLLKHKNHTRMKDCTKCIEIYKQIKIFNQISDKIRVLSSINSFKLGKIFRTIKKITQEKSPVESQDDISESQRISEMLSRIPSQSLKNPNFVQILMKCGRNIN